MELENLALASGLLPASATVAHPSLLAVANGISVKVLYVVYCEAPLSPHNPASGDRERFLVLCSASESNRSDAHRSTLKLVFDPAT